MVFTDAERSYLAARDLARLATVGPTGAPHNQPVAFWLNDDGTVDIGGPALTSSQKYRNVVADPRVSLVVDDNAPEPVGPGGQRGRGIEIRGTVEVVRLPEPLISGFTRDVLRVRPRRIVTWNVGEPGGRGRDVRA
ncbi:PPOX class F420-dependent oxidoreductase [Pseudonocardia sp. CA-107938]|uniref:PPOX class F420-dependent oxidoreductase n=1 Tax=Pseudonocardia sp. CA-107938 TaxID=3240021 RepID=UPI003D8ACE44